MTSLDHRSGSSFLSSLAEQEVRHQMADTFEAKVRELAAQSIWNADDTEYSFERWLRPYRGQSWSTQSVFDGNNSGSSLKWQIKWEGSRTSSLALRYIYATLLLLLFEALPAGTLPSSSMRRTELRLNDWISELRGELQNALPRINRSSRSAKTWARSHLASVLYLIPIWSLLWPPFRNSVASKFFISP